MLKYAVKLFKEEDGQAMTEYGLLVGLIALAVIAAIVLLGDQLKFVFDTITEKLTAIDGAPDGTTP